MDKRRVVGLFFAGAGVLLGPLVYIAVEGMKPDQAAWVWALAALLVALGLVVALLPDKWWRKIFKGAAPVVEASPIPTGAIVMQGSHGNVFSNINIISGGNTIKQVPAPVLKIGKPTSERVGDGYRITIPLDVVAPYPPADLYVEIHAPGARDLDLQMSGAVTTHRTGNREGMAFHEIQHPHGRIIAKVYADTNQVELQYQFK